MISSKDFPSVVYTEPRLEDDRPKIANIVGIDSEAYTTGEPFIFCTSYGDVFDPHASPECFFSEKYQDTNFVVWNLKYDSGAILYYFPRETLLDLWENGKTIYNSPEGFYYKITYVPHKLLRITSRRHQVNFWEISQFYHSSLDRAAQTYLNESKEKIQTKNFSPRYVARVRKHLIRYCIRDAILTARLGTYLVDKLDQFGITASSLYSSASISFKYFASRTSIVTSWRFWNEDRDVLALASDAYEGGKFEVTTRGPFRGYEYDISSAYPYEIANLVDIQSATVIYTTEFQPKAVYGFLDCIIDNNTVHHIPCGPMVNGVRIYPMGHFRMTITAPEYLYLLSLGIQVEVKRGCWLFVKRKRYPYRKIVHDLYAIKSEMKDTDAMLYNVTKVVLNGFYGKMAQSIRQPDGNILVGAGWNPVYASYITANTRLKVTKIQNLMQDDCLAVHTDSVITTRPLPDSVATDNALGNFGPVIDGDGIIVACGMYQIADQYAFKGFAARKGESWRTILERFPHRKTVPYRVLHVESWLEAMAKNHSISHINVFARTRKLMSLNCDKKRLWNHSVKAKDLLERTERSSPKIYVEKT